MMRDLNATEFQATQGLSMYALGFGIVPLVTASFSEEFGRQPLYFFSGIGFLLMYIMVGLSVAFPPLHIITFLLTLVGDRLQSTKHTNRYCRSVPAGCFRFDSSNYGWWYYRRYMGTCGVSVSCSLHDLFI
jgi:MFS family permease